MNLDLAIASNVEKDIEEVDLELNKTILKLQELIHRKEKLLLFKSISSLSPNDRQIHISEKDSGGRSTGS